VWLAIFYAAVGAILGTLVGNWLARYWPPLGHYYLMVGTGVDHPWTVDLKVVGLQAGFWIHVNLGGILGLLVGLVVFQRSR
jgi:hypothetical protein